MFRQPYISPALSSPTALAGCPAPSVAPCQCIQRVFMKKQPWNEKKNPKNFDHKNDRSILKLHTFCMILWFWFNKLVNWNGTSSKNILCPLPALVHQPIKPPWFWCNFYHILCRLGILKMWMLASQILSGQILSSVQFSLHVQPSW